MAVFAVILQPSQNPNRLAENIQQRCGGRYISVGPGVWFVSIGTTPQGLSNLLGISEGREAAGIVVEVAGYWGHAVPSVWDWFRAFWSVSHNG